jgi:3-hydroxyisobutyrate dehydrogenase
VSAVASDAARDARPMLGYVGVGLMGGPMVARLVARGWSVRAFDLVPERLRAAVEAGAQAAVSPADAARGAGLVLLNLPTTDAVDEAVFGPDGVAAALAAPARIVDFSTVEVERGRGFAARLRAQTGCGWVDAPVSGGPPASAAGTLTVMVGGERDDVAAASVLWPEVAARVTHMGPPGAGLAAKMINQLIVGCTHAVLAEAAVMAEAAGIDAERLPECLAGGHADGTLLQRLYPRMVARDFAPQGYARQLLKDLELVGAFSGALKSPTPMAGQALSLYRMLIRLGHAELDTSAVMKLYEPPTGPHRDQEETP